MREPSPERLADYGQLATYKERTADEEELLFRHRRAVRFGRMQRRSREWLSVNEIAEWCAQLEGVVVPNEKARLHAYRMFAQDISEGFFELWGASSVLFLTPELSYPRRPMARLGSAEQVWQVLDLEILIEAYLKHCWIARGDFRRWCEYHELPSNPRRFRRPPRRPADARLAKSEPAASSLVASLLRDDPFTTRTVAENRLKTLGYQIGPRAFARVWPRARIRAGLPEKGRPGRRPQRRSEIGT